MCIRIQLSRATVKDLPSRLQHAYQRDDVRLVRRSTVWLDLLVHHVPVAVLEARWGRSLSCLYHWRQAFLLRGMDRLVSHHGGGRRPQWPPRQTHRLVELMEAGPLVVGGETACWTSVRSRVLSWRECGVLYNGQYVCTLLHNLGFACHKARLVSAHLDAARRPHWLQQAWPTIVRTAKRRKGLRLCAAEASGAPWGSLRATWARRGQPPEVTTSGKRKGSKVFGAMAYCSGRLCSQGIEGRLTSESDQGFVPMILTHTTEHLFVIHDGARYHTSQATEQFVATHRERITLQQLPSYSPDDNPIASLWKKTKQRATHNQYCKAFATWTVSVDKALASCAVHPDMV